MRQDIVADQILEVVRIHSECPLDELIKSLPGLGWAEIVHGVIRLTRSGQLQLSESRLGLTTTLHAL
jgi:hypothetical protein